MADYYSSSPLPTPAAGTLPYPWVTQFDQTHQATFYVNLETQESTWTLPDLSLASSPSYQAFPAVEGTRGMSDNMYGGGASNSYSRASITQSYPTSSNGAGGGNGEAASFYGSSGTTPQAPGQTTYSDQTQPQYDANGQPIEGGERGLGKIIVGGGAMYLAYKLYKDYQKGKLSQQQFKPPNPSKITPQLHPPHGSNHQNVHYPQDHFRPPNRDNNATMNPPMPNWDQKPPNTAPYGGAAPAPYNTGTNYQVCD